MSKLDFIKKSKIINRWLAFIFIFIFATASYIYILEVKDKYQGEISGDFIISITSQTIVGCDYYAAPTRSGLQDGSSEANPFLISDFWNVAEPGSILCLLDGHYTGADSMIAPPSGLNGTEADRITVRALNEGMAEIDAESVAGRKAIVLTNNDYFIIEGMNAHSAGLKAHAVVHLATGADHNIVRRVIAWDAYPCTTCNAHIFAASDNEDNLFEDCAGWGSARKIFSIYAADHITFRRCFGQWENWPPVDSAYEGPRDVFTTAYKSYYGSCENCIGTWNTTQARDPIGRFIAIMAVDHMTGESTNAAYSKYLGSISYISASEESTGFYSLYHKANNMSSHEIKDSIAYAEWPGADYNYIYLDNSGADTDLSLTNSISIGVLNSTIRSSVSTSNFNHYNTAAAATSALGSIYKSNTGPNICNRYVDGALTTEPLWPWPMNDRIMVAYAQTHDGEQFDLQTKIESMFGSIPEECLSSSEPKVPVCLSEQITSICSCGGTQIDSGYCCDGTAQDTPCTSGTIDMQVLSGSIAVDGSLNDWVGADSVTFSDDSGRGTADNTAIASALWDSEYLYISVDVTDTNVISVNTGTDSNTWEDDAVEINIDTLHNKGSVLQPDDYKIIINTNNAIYDKSGAGEWVSNSLSSIVETASGYVLEIAIPWSSLNLNPSQGYVLGMDIGIHDEDGTTSYEYFDWANLISFNFPDGWKSIELSLEEIVPDQTCIDGTLPNACSLTQKGKYCYESQLVDECLLCGCLDGYICQSDGTCVLDDIPPTIESFDVSPREGDSSFDISWSISDIGGSYLDTIQIYRAEDISGIPQNWQLVPGSSKDYYSGLVSSDSGTFTDTPAIGTWWYGIHVSDNAGNLSYEPNPPGPIKVVKNATIQTCLDGTLPNTCSLAQEGKYCYESQLINKCSACGCPDGYICQSDETCLKESTPSSDPTCLDGTPYNQCSLSTKPDYCNKKGRLIDNCSECGCPDGYICQPNDSCIIDTSSPSDPSEPDQYCLDGTLYYDCSSNKPFYCDNGNLVENCSLCGCSDSNYCQSNNTCSVDNIAPQINYFGVSLQVNKRSFSIAWNIMDEGGSFLKEAKVYRAPDNNGQPGEWQLLDNLTKIFTGNVSSDISTFTDTPAIGTWWYGIHVSDNAGNLSYEPNPPGPIKVVKTKK